MPDTLLCGMAGRWANQIGRTQANRSPGARRSSRAPDKGWELTALRGHCSNVPECVCVCVCVCLQRPGRIWLKKGGVCV